MKSGPEDQKSRLPDWLVAVLLTEGAALLIAIITPLTPSKTGSRWSPAELFIVDPTYLEQVVVSFVAVNLLISILAVLAWITLKRGGA